MQWQIIGLEERVEGIVIDRQNCEYTAELYLTNKYGVYVKEGEMIIEPQGTIFIDSSDSILAELITIAKQKFPGMSVYITEDLFEYLFLPPD